MAQPRTPLRPLDLNSIRRKELSTTQRAAICAAAKFGHNSGEIARVLEHPVSTVKSILQRAPSDDNYESKPRSGRPKLRTATDERHIRRIARRTPNITYKHLIQQTGVQLSRTTVYRLLKEHGITK